GELGQVALILAIACAPPPCSSQLKSALSHLAATIFVPSMCGAPHSSAVSDSLACAAKGHDAAPAAAALARNSLRLSSMSAPLPGQRALEYRCVSLASCGRNH